MHFFAELMCFFINLSIFLINFLLSISMLVLLNFKTQSLFEYSLKGRQFLI